MKKNQIIYWISTALVILIAGIGSIADLIQIEPVRESITAIGFPLYVLPFFGVMKILGTAAITVPALARFKEAAYAGLVFYFLGAVYCHVAVGDGLDKLGAPLLILLAIGVSYIYSPRPSAVLKNA